MNDILEQFNESFPAFLFSSTVPLSGPNTKDACTKIKKIEELIMSANQQWWDVCFWNSILSPKCPHGDFVYLRIALS